MKRTHAEQEGYYRSLSRRILLTVILVSIAPMIVVSALLLYQFHLSYKQKVYAHLETLVKKHRRSIDGFLTERLSDIRFLARTFSYEEFSDPSFLEDRLATLQDAFGGVFVDMGVINSRGLQVAYAGPFKLGQALYGDAAWFQEVMKRGAVISDVFLGKRGLPHFIVAVRDNWRGDSWILRATVDFVAFNDLVEQIRIGETGFAFILNREGKLQTQTPFEISLVGGPCMKWVEGGKAFQTEVCIEENKDASGEDFIHVGAYLKNDEWLLVFRQRTFDAFSDYWRAVEVTVGILLLGTLAIGIMAFILSKRIVGRIAEVDKEKDLMNEQIIETGKLASVGELAAGIAHEINNPVAIMVEEAGWVEDLLEEEDFKEGKNLQEFRRALDQIRVQGRRCKDITHKLLSFARKTDSRVLEVNLNEVVTEVASLSEQRAKYANVTIQLYLYPNLPVLQASPSEIQQVLLNLINNALDAMEKGGGTIDISTRLDGKNVVLEVSDTGKGIPEANLSRMFDPFFTTKPVGKGTGLGLSICYGIIKKLGGDISVDSQVDEGTTFRVSIPFS